MGLFPLGGQTRLSSSTRRRCRPQPESVVHILGFASGGMAGGNGAAISVPKCDAVSELLTRDLFTSSMLPVPENTLRTHL